MDLVSLSEKRVTHLVKRAKKWYRIKLTKGFCLELIWLVRIGAYEKKVNSYWGRAEYFVLCRGILMRAVFTPNLKPVTILPLRDTPEYREWKSRRTINRRRFA